MSKQKSSESRRKLLKSIAVGSGAIVAGKSLPENWTKPVVDSVMLPAHAQTSPTEPANSYYGTGLSTFTFGDAPPSTGPTATVCAILNGDTLDVTLQRSQNNARRQGQLNIDGTPGTLTVIAQSSNCEVTPNDLNAQVVNVTDESFELRFAPDFVDVTDGAIATIVPSAVCDGFSALDGACNGNV